MRLEVTVLNDIYDSSLRMYPHTYVFNGLRNVSWWVALVRNQTDWDIHIEPCDRTLISFETLDISMGEKEVELGKPVAVIILEYFDGKTERIATDSDFSIVDSYGKIEVKVEEEEEEDEDDENDEK